MKKAIFALTALMTVSAFAAEVKVEEPSVRVELQKAANEIGGVVCKHSGTKGEYNYADKEMLNYIRNAPALALDLYVDQASSASLILRGKLQGNDGRYTISYNLTDDLNHIATARYVYETETSETKNVGNILKPRYETVVTKAKLMDAKCEVVLKY